MAMVYTAAQRNSCITALFTVSYEDNDIASLFDESRNDTDRGSLAIHDARGVSSAP
jgi:hypothetical protein